jgi:hypothetical protein
MFPVTNLRPSQLSSPRKRGPSNLMSLLYRLNTYVTEFWFPAFAGMTNVVEAVSPGTTFGLDTQDELGGQEASRKATRTHLERSVPNPKKARSNAPG